MARTAKAGLKMTKNVPHALSLACKDLIAELDAGITVFRTNLENSNRDKVHDQVLRFANEFSRIPGGAEELEYRANYVATHCKSGTEYQTLMDDFFECYNANQTMAVPVRQSGASLAVQNLKPTHDVFLESHLRDTINDLENALKCGVIPDTCRDKLGQLLDEAREIADEARHIESDGCFFIGGGKGASKPSPNELNEIAVSMLLSGVGGVYLESIRAAAESLMDWGNQMRQKPAIRSGNLNLGHTHSRKTQQQTVKPKLAATKNGATTRNQRSRLTNTTKARNRRPATANERMAGEIIKKPDAMGWNSPKWSQFLKCAKSTVVATQTWKKLESARLQAKAERMLDRRRKPKASERRKD